MLKQHPTLGLTSKYRHLPAGLVWVQSLEPVERWKERTNSTGLFSEVHKHVVAHMPIHSNKQTNRQTKQAFTCLKPTKFSQVNGRRQTQLDSQLSCYCKPGHFLHLLPSPFPSSFYLPSLSPALEIKPRDLCMLAKYSYHWTTLVFQRQDIIV